MAGVTASAGGASAITRVANAAPAARPPATLSAVLREILVFFISSLISSIGWLTLRHFILSVKSKSMIPSLDLIGLSRQKTRLKGPATRVHGSGSEASWVHRQRADRAQERAALRGAGGCFPCRAGFCSDRRERAGL